MSEFRIEKRREAAEVTLSTGATLLGNFFLAGHSQVHSGPERVGDVLNHEPGFFPFEATAGDTALLNRAHIVKVVLPLRVIEAQLDAGYDVATRRRVSVLLSNGERLTGTVAIYRPANHDRLSDYAQHEEHFRYLELADHTVLINSIHIVSLSEVD
jgi:hypothetical protein